MSVFKSKEARGTLCDIHQCQNQTLVLLHHKKLPMLAITQIQHIKITIDDLPNVMLCHSPKQSREMLTQSRYIELKTEYLHKRIITRLPKTLNDQRIHRDSLTSFSVMPTQQKSYDKIGWFQKTPTSLGNHYKTPNNIHVLYNIP